MAPAVVAEVVVIYLVAVCSFFVGVMVGMLLAIWGFVAMLRVGHERRAKA